MPVGKKTTSKPASSKKRSAAGKSATSKTFSRSKTAKKGNAGPAAPKSARGLDRGKKPPLSASEQLEYELDEAAISLNRLI